MGPAPQESTISPTRNSVIHQSLSKFQLKPPTILLNSKSYQIWLAIHQYHLILSTSIIPQQTNLTFVASYLRTTLAALSESRSEPCIRPTDFLKPGKFLSKHACCHVFPSNNVSVIVALCAIRTVGKVPFVALRGNEMVKRKRMFTDLMAQTNLIVEGYVK